MYTHASLFIATIATMAIVAITATIAVIVVIAVIEATAIIAIKRPACAFTAKVTQSRSVTSTLAISRVGQKSEKVRPEKINYLGQMHTSDQKLRITYPLSVNPSAFFSRCNINIH